LDPLKSDVQRDENRQYAPNQALGHLEGVHMGHHEAWVRQYWPFYVPSNEHEKRKFIVRIMRIWEIYQDIISCFFWAFAKHIETSEGYEPSRNSSRGSAPMRRGV
jgi:hypothetical protein